ncbi:MAG: rane-associated phospholipid phosphatase [Planctomycetota bacterium]|nr:rane-associated phospholipid phosphatase [Planctomycetota bacterium]
MIRDPNLAASPGPRGWDPGSRNVHYPFPTVHRPRLDDTRALLSRAPYWPYPVAFAAVIVLGHFLGGWVDMEGDVDPGSMDHTAREWVVRNRGAWPVMTRLARAVTLLGNPEAATTAIIVIAATFFVLRQLGIGNIRKGEALFWLVVAGGGRLLSIGLKLWFRRHRPPFAHRLVHETTFSFPSGHGLFAGAFFVLIAMVILRESTGIPRWSRPILIAFGLLIAVAVGASRIWLGVHYVSDVLAGFLLGLIWAGVAVVIRFGWVRWFRSPPRLTARVGPD